MIGLGSYSFFWEQSAMNHKALSLAEVLIEGNGIPLALVPISLGIFGTLAWVPIPLRIFGIWNVRRRNKGRS